MKYILVMILAGCASAPRSEVAAPAGAAPVSTAKVAADEAYGRFSLFLVDFMNGKADSCADFFDPAMIGRQELVNAVNESKINQKSIVIEEDSSRTQALGDSTAVIQLVWEKRYIKPAGSQVTKRGETHFYIQRTGGDWRLVGMTGDNLLVP